jgi:hypothetical protein
MKADRDVVDRALACIKPDDEKKEACRKQVTNIIANMRIGYRLSRSSPLMSEQREQLADFAKAAKQMIKAVERLYDGHAYAVFAEPQQTLQHPNRDAFVAQLKRSGYVAGGLSMCLDVKKVADPNRWGAAKLAEGLMKEFGRRPTKRVGGDYYTLTSIMYEGAGGKRETDLSKECRSVLDNKPPPEGQMIRGIPAGKCRQKQ